MSGRYEPMLEMFIFETSQLLEQFEEAVIGAEKAGQYGENAINQIFRITHTIKGSAAMMLVDEVSHLAHAVEDVFFLLRKQNPASLDCSLLSDILLEVIDFIKGEMEKLKSGGETDGKAQLLIEKSKRFLQSLKESTGGPGIEAAKPDNLKQQYYIGSSKPASNTNYFCATVWFEDGCEMENIRAYTIVHNLKDRAENLVYEPADIIDREDSAQVIREQGFRIWVATTQSYQEILGFLGETIFLKDLQLIEDNGDKFSKPVAKEIILEDEPVRKPEIAEEPVKAKPAEGESSSGTQQSIISVSVAKLDGLMDLVGELVISEAMVTQNPDLHGLLLDNFSKAARQLRKICSELQDMVMSIRMVPLATTFHKMHRIVRDMSKKLNKEVQLELIGEATEVDKNIIEHISDPLMHIIRNSLDHGIEPADERVDMGKPAVGTITLEAKNAGSDVLIIVRDDGRGLNKEKILKKARENNLIFKPEEELTDREIYSFIFHPGFSTKEQVTEFSGRGVGMDVVMRNINSVGGSVVVTSSPGEGSTFTLKIPLTLAIIDGMNIAVGDARYTVPTISIRQSFRPQESDIIQDTDGREMIMVRGQCYPILRLHELYRIQTKTTQLWEGILVMLETEQGTACMFADALLGEQQVVVKALPPYIRNLRDIEGIAGCTLLGDGSISLIVDPAGFINLLRH